jgi:hypothetical protein
MQRTSLGDKIESNLFWIPPNPHQLICVISPRIILSTLSLGLNIESNLIHTPLGPHFVHFVCSNTMGCEYNSLVKSMTISRQETIYHSVVDLYISEFTSRASVPPVFLLCYCYCIWRFGRSGANFRYFIGISNEK